MKLNTNLIIGAALIGGGAYYAYKKGLFGGKKETTEDVIKQNQDVIDKIAAEQAQKKASAVTAVKASNAIKQATTINNPNSYAGKVAFIQSSLGIAVDGNAGSQTNKSFDSVYGLDKGNISTTNIDYYVNRVKTKNTLAAIKAANAAAAAKKTAANKVINDANRFLELVNKGNYKATLTKDVTSSALIWDVRKQQYVNLNEPRTFRKGSEFSHGQFTPTPRGGFVMWYENGNPSALKRYALNPNDFLVTT